MKETLKNISWETEISFTILINCHDDSNIEVEKKVK